LVPQTGQPWPPPGGSYQNNMQPGSSTPINVAINSAQWSVPMVCATPYQPASTLGSATGVLALGQLTMARFKLLTPLIGLASSSTLWDSSRVSVIIYASGLVLGDCSFADLVMLCCVVREAADGEGHDHRLHHLRDDADPEPVHAGPRHQRVPRGQPCSRVCIQPLHFVKNLNPVCASQR